MPCYFATLSCRLGLRRSHICRDPARAEEPQRFPSTRSSGSVGPRAWGFPAVVRSTAGPDFASLGEGWRGGGVGTGSEYRGPRRAPVGQSGPVRPGSRPEALRACFLLCPGPGEWAAPRTTGRRRRPRGRRRPTTGSTAAAAGGTGGAGGAADPAAGQAGGAAAGGRGAAGPPPPPPSPARPGRRSPARALAARCAPRGRAGLAACARVVPGLEARRGRARRGAARTVPPAGPAQARRRWRRHRGGGRARARGVRAGGPVRGGRVRAARAWDGGVGGVLGCKC